MSRTKIPDSLIHNSKEVEQNAHLFDHLCRVFQLVFQPAIEATVRDSLKQRLETDDESGNDFKEEFDGALRSEMSFITGYWINVLDGTCRVNQLSLTEHLLPRNREYGQLFFHYLGDNYGIVESETRRLMGEIREKLFDNVLQILLPLNLGITKKSDRYHLKVTR